MGARPPRWLKCPRKSTIIHDTFVAFKTFLDDRYDNQVPVEDRYQYIMLKSFVMSHKREIGLIIDLTGTDRYYDPSTIKKDGVGYCKIKCRGHGQAPSEEQVNVFVNVCSKFLRENPGKIIGVHCTHGFNRSGFMIVSYLVQNLDWNPEDATQVFAHCRSPGIYKDHYIKDLWNRFGMDPQEAPPAPELPDWCFEEEEGFSDEEEPSNKRNGGDFNDGGGPPRKKRRRPHHVENPKFCDGVTGVEAVSTRGMERLQDIAESMLNWDRGNFPGCQPVSMDRRNIEHLNNRPYRVSWKADGTRYLMLILKEGEVYLFDRDNSVFEADLTFPRRKSPEEHVFDTLVDGELVLDKEGDRLHPRFLIYDIIKFEGQDVGQTDLDRRHLCIEKELIGPRNLAAQAGKLDKSKEPFAIRKKDFYPIDQAIWILDNLNPKMPHETDGLIFQPLKDHYTPGQCPYVMKWKPSELNSVDFMLNIRTVERVGCLPEKVGGLYVQGYDQPFSSMKVTSELKHYDKRIIECTWDGKSWKFLRVREDKSFPNTFKTAQSVCESIKFPVTKEILMDYINRFGFRQHGAPGGQGPKQ